MKALLLAAGYGTRLKPLTDYLPKCLMPIKGLPLLEYWLYDLNKLELSGVLLNMHHMHSEVNTYLKNSKYLKFISTSVEKKLLGTAGTIKNNFNYFKGESLLVIHADNFCSCDLGPFIKFHFKKRPQNTVMSMMVFETSNPKNCGVIKINEKNVVTSFFEKVDSPPSTLANAAIYILENEVIEFINNIDKEIIDFSIDVIPHFIGKIAAWSNTEHLIDIGTIENLKKAQKIKLKNKIDSKSSQDWLNNYKENIVHRILEKN